MTHRPVSRHATDTGRWMPAFVLVLALSTLVPTLFNVEWPVAVSARVFVVLAAVSHMTLAALCCCVPGWICLRIGRLHRVVVPATVLPAALWLVVVVIDARVFQQFGFHVNGLVIVMLLQGGLLEQLGLEAAAWVALGVGVIVATALFVLVVRGLRAPGGRSTPRPRQLLWLLPMLLASNAWAIWQDATGHSAGLAASQAVPWLPMPTARSFMVRAGLAPERGPRQASSAAARPTARFLYPRAPLHCHAPRRLNVLMLVVDSLREDMLTPTQMPATWNFARQAWRGTRHYSTGNNTMHGMFGLFYGLPAVHTTAMIQQRRGPELLRELQAQGYDMHLYGGASLRGARLDRTAFVQTHAPLHEPPPGTPRDQRDAVVLADLQQALRAQPADRPFFAMVLLDSVHAPYAVPPGAAQPYQPQAAEGDHLRVSARMDPAPLFNRYRNAVLEMDAKIGKVLQALDALGRAEDTVVIITGDHGESFNDLGQNDWGHNSNFSDVQTRVPMLIRWPGRAAVTETAVTSHMDLAPTLLRHLSGCSNPVDDYAAGLDLFSPLPQIRPLLVESWTARALRVGERTVLLRPYGVEVRDAAYRRVDQDSTLDPAINAAIINQMQLLR